MCWNAEVSLQSFALGMAAILLGALSGLSLPVLFFCFTIVSMQFIEYIVWSNYENQEINTQASVAAASLLWIQPIASILTLENSSTKLIFLFSYLLLTAVGSLVEEKKEYSMKRAKNGHLSWNWLKNTSATFISLSIYFFFLFVPLVLAGNSHLLLLAIITLGISLFTYWKDNTWGSMWCWIVNGIVLLVVGKSVLFKT